MADRKEKLAAVDAALRGAFSALEARGAPEHLLKVVDQLDAAAAAEDAAADDADEVRPSPGPPSSPEP